MRTDISRWQRCPIPLGLTKMLIKWHMFIKWSVNSLRKLFFPSVFHHFKWSFNTRCCKSSNWIGVKTCEMSHTMFLFRCVPFGRISFSFSSPTHTKYLPLTSYFGSLKAKWSFLVFPSLSVRTPKQSRTRLKVQQQLYPLSMRAGCERQHCSIFMLFYPFSSTFYNPFSK